jgi:hypothetical protein
MRKKQAPEELSEKQWSQQFKGLFTVLGWVGYHPYLSIHSERGWPDWSLVHLTTKRLIFVELKKESGKLSDSQIRWRDLLEATGQEWYCLKPSQFDEAAEILRARPAVSAPQGLSDTTRKDEVTSDEHD